MRNKPLVVEIRLFVVDVEVVVIAVYGYGYTSLVAALALAVELNILIFLSISSSSVGAPLFRSSRLRLVAWYGLMPLCAAWPIPPAAFMAAEELTDWLVAKPVVVAPSCAAAPPALPKLAVAALL